MPSSAEAFESLPNPEQYTVQDFFGLLRRHFRQALVHQTQIDEALAQREGDTSINGSIGRHPANTVGRGFRKQRQSRFLMRINSANSDLEKVMIMLRIPEEYRPGAYYRESYPEVDLLNDTSVAVYFSLPDRGMEITEELIDECDDFVIRAVSPETDVSYYLDNTGIRQAGADLDPEAAYARAMEQLENNNLLVEDLFAVNDQQNQEITSWVQVLELFETTKFNPVKS